MKLFLKVTCMYWKEIWIQQIPKNILLLITDLIMENKLTANIQQIKSWKVKKMGVNFLKKNCPWHSGIKEMYSSVNVLNGQQVVIENKKVCNHCHRKLNPDFFFFANKFGYGLRKSQNGEANW